MAVTVLKALPTAIAAVVFLGAVAVYLRGSRDKGTIVTLEQNNRALSERVQILENGEQVMRAELNAVRAENESVRAENESVRAENEILRTVDGAADAIAGLQVSLDSHHDDAMERLDALLSALTADGRG